MCTTKKKKQTNQWYRQKKNDVHDIDNTCVCKNHVAQHRIQSSSFFFKYKQSPNQRLNIDRDIQINNPMDIRINF